MERTGLYTQASIDKAMIAAGHATGGLSVTNAFANPDYEHIMRGSNIHRMLCNDDIHQMYEGTVQQFIRIAIPFMRKSNTAWGGKALSDRCEKELIRRCAACPFVNISCSTCL